MNVLGKDRCLSLSQIPFLFVVSDSGPSDPVYATNRVGCEKPACGMALSEDCSLVVESRRVGVGLVGRGGIGATPGATCVSCCMCGRMCHMLGCRTVDVRGSFAYKVALARKHTRLKCS